TISRFRAVATVGRLQIGGTLGWPAWLVVHLVFLTGFKNRLSALANWTVAFLGRGRRQRTITKQHELARSPAHPVRAADAAPGAKPSYLIPENPPLTTGRTDDRRARGAARPDPARAGRPAHPHLLRDHVRRLHHRHVPQAASERHQGRCGR